VVSTALRKEPAERAAALDHVLDRLVLESRVVVRTQEVATTMAFVRLLKDLLRSKDFGHRIVPIIPDEARTFGLDAFFPTAKRVEDVDRDQRLAVRGVRRGGAGEGGDGTGLVDARTTLTGEGLQHADGHSHLLASTNPATVSYDPAYGYEIAHIVRSGLEPWRP
jgi:pyruvate dehydrogenase E1 component